jgi:hypothetical protein
VARGVGALALVAAGLVAAGASLAPLLGAGAGGSCPFLGGAHCLAVAAAFGLPALALTGWLVLRAWPVRPRWAGAFGGVGAGLIADGIQHLICPFSDLVHVLVWHLGAIAGLGLLGWLAGVALERRRNARGGWE